MRRAATAAGLLLAAAGVTLASGPEVSVSRDLNLLRVETTLPGTVLDMAVHRNAAGAGALVLLIRPAVPDAAGGVDCHDADTRRPLELWTVTPPRGAEPPRVERLRDDIAPGTQRLWSLVRGATGADTLVAAEPGVLSAWPLDGGARLRLIEEAHLRPWGATLLQGGPAPHGLLVVADLGRAKFLRRDGTDGGFSTLLELPLHKDVAQARHGLRLNSRPPVYIGAAGDTLHFATPPVAQSRRRLRGHAVAIAGDEVRHHAWWAGLPDAEEVLETHFVMFGAEPALLVTTRRADKLGLFGEKLLRLFRLREDRSRTGHPPFFSARTQANLWQSVMPYVRDVDGDSVDDLILAYWKGLKDDRVVLDVYPGRSDGSLSSSPRTTAFDVAGGDRSFIEFGADLGGDGVADLLLRARGRLLVFGGNPAGEDGRALVATKASHEVTPSAESQDDDDEQRGGVVVGIGGGGLSATELGGGRPRPRLVDLNSDGRRQVVDLTRPADGSQKLTLLLLD